MNPDEFLKKELNLRVLIGNMNSNLSYAAIVALLTKYDYYRTVEKSGSKGNDTQLRTEGTCRGF